jgi:hypothetical protein
MTSFESKSHVALDGFPFLLAQMPRTGRHFYGREEAPNFVNKMSSGDPNYRDSTFFPHWVQNNWLNGFDQEKWNDAGRSYRSTRVDTTEQEVLKLERNFSSTGQVASGVNILTQVAWRAGSSSAFGDGSDGVLTVSADDVYDADFPTTPLIDVVCTGTSGSTSLTATGAFVANQVVLVHQTQGTGAGTWLKTKVSSYSTGTITLVDALNATYGTGAQVVVMRQYSAVTIDSAKTLTAKAWDGTTGGILPFMCNGTVTVTGTISGKGTDGVFQSGNTGNADTTGGGFYGGRGGGNQPFSGWGQNANGAFDTANTGGSGGGGHQDSSGAGGGNGAAGTNGSGTTGGIATGNAALTLMDLGGGGGGGSWSGLSGSGGSGGGVVFLFVKSLTVAGGITTNGGAGGSGSTGRGGGGGAGGSILIKAQTITLGTGLVTAAGGAGGAGSAAAGGAGSVGRIHIDYATSFTGTTTPTLDSTQDATLTDTPASSTFTHIVGASNGKIYSWDGATTYTELYDARRLTSFEAGTDENLIVGDVGGVETAQSQGFKVTTTTKVKAVQVYIKKNAGTPGDITCTIETDSSAKPSGSLANALATATIPAFATATYGWITVEFSGQFSLTGGTTYHVVLKTAAAANDQNYAWAADGSSPGYADGAMSVSVDGGSTWNTATKDAYFRVLGNATQVNCSIVSTISGSSKVYFGIGSPTATDAGDARIISYDGTTFAINKTFVGTSEIGVFSFAEFGLTPKLYVGLGAIAKIYTTPDATTYTLTKTITVPSNPGFVLCMKEYGGRLYVGGGYPTLLHGANYQYFGFLYSWDEYSWTNVSPFEFTVVTSLWVFDNLLFIGTIKKFLYVYNTASMDKLFEFPWNVQITDMKTWDDKLTIALATTPGSSSEGHEGIYIFDRNGFHNAFNVTGKSWYSLATLNNNLMAGNDDGYVYQTNVNTYISSGTLQTSYFEASLPSMEKHWRSLGLHTEALPTGCSILIEYQFDESDASWTTLGTYDNVGATYEEFTFTDAVYSKKITFRLTLTTTVPADSPEIKVMDVRYVISPTLKYLWKMKFACPDNIVWLDGTEPISTSTATIAAAQVTLPLADGDGFPTKGRAVIDTTDEFTWTGKTGDTLTGVVGLLQHTTAGLTVKMTGATMHKQLLTMKQTREFFTFTDIDGLTYEVLFHQFQEEDFVVNQESGIENNVPVSILET